MNPVAVSLLMHFTSGPETHVFYACEAHRQELAKGDVSCFYRLPYESIQPADEDDGECYFCRGEHGPDH